MTYSWTFDPAFIPTFGSSSEDPLFLENNWSAHFENFVLTLSFAVVVTLSIGLVCLGTFILYLYLFSRSTHVIDFGRLVAAPK